MKEYFCMVEIFHLEITQIKFLSIRREDSFALLGIHPEETGNCLVGILAMDSASLFSSSSSSSIRNSPEEGGEEERRNWEDAPRDVMVTILMKLTPREILESVQFVCKSWYEACQDSSAWTKIQILGKPASVYGYKEIPFIAVNRSRGLLREISLEYVCNDSLLLLIAERSNNLRCLRIRCCNDLSAGALSEAFKIFFLLEEVEFTDCRLNNSMIRSVGRSCPNLVSFKLNCRGIGFRYLSPSDIEDSNQNALAIAETMPRLHHLQLLGSMMENEGLQAILDSCSCLESIDLRACFQVDLLGDLGKRCAEKVKNVKWPQDSTSGSGFQRMAYEGGYVEYFNELEHELYISDDNPYEDLDEPEIYLSDGPDYGYLDEPVLEACISDGPDYGFLDEPELEVCISDILDEPGHEVCISDGPDYSYLDEPGHEVCISDGPDCSYLDEVGHEVCISDGPDYSYLDEPSHEGCISYGPDYSYLDEPGHEVCIFDGPDYSYLDEPGHEFYISDGGYYSYFGEL